MVAAATLVRRTHADGFAANSGGPPGRAAAG